MKSVAFRDNFFWPSQPCASKRRSPKRDLDKVHVQQFALPLSNKVCNQAPIIQTLSNINIQWVFWLRQMRLKCCESRINVAKGNVILLEESHRLDTWVKNPELNS
jgi:hypothetical protein